MDRVEYRVISAHGRNAGELETTLNAAASDGYRLVAAVTVNIGPLIVMDRPAQSEVTTPRISAAAFHDANDF